MSTQLGELATRIDAHLAGKVKRALPINNTHPCEITCEVEPADLLEVCRNLRDEPQLKFEMLMDVCGVDYLHYGHDEWKTFESTDTGFSRGVARSGDDKEEPRDVPERFDPPLKDLPLTGRVPRFAVVYHLLSLTHNWRLRLRCACADDAQPMVDSVVGIWTSADWFEREAFDLFGILFRGHPDLRRILTDYGFIGHPFRKDFPLIGNVEVRYDPTQQRVIYEPVSIEPRTLVPKVIREDNRYEIALKDVKPADKPHV